MSLYRRYFRVTEGPLIAAVKEIETFNKAGRAEYEKILIEIGAKLNYYHQGEKLKCFLFDKEPDTKIFKRVQPGWYPKKTSKVAKAFALRFEAVKIKNPQDAMEVIGLSTNDMMIRDMKIASPQTITIPGDTFTVYVVVPWYDDDPEKKTTEKLLLWKPAPELNEVKEWEVRKHIEEWNENIRTKE